MVLGFKQKFPWGEPTYFREKILAGVGYVWGASAGKIVTYDSLLHATSTPIIKKLHTIRAGNRWKSGDKIHMAYGVRTKNYEQFNKDIPWLDICVSVQRIKLIWVYKNKYIETNLPLRTINGPHGEFEYYPCIWIDNKPMNESQIESLAINDGFNNLNDFFKWFNKDFTGQIIHWTKLQY